MVLVDDDVLVDVVRTEDDVEDDDVLVKVARTDDDDEEVDVDVVLVLVRTLEVEVVVAAPKGPFWQTVCIG